MITIHVAANPHVYDPLAAFQSGEGARVLKLFQDGAVLKVWRHTSPANWWLEHADGREYHWDANPKLRAAGTPDVWLLTRLAKVIESSETLTAAGKPGKEAWAYDEAAMAHAQALWARAQECAADWAAQAAPAPASVANLSPMAQAALLTLRSKAQLPMRGELLPILLELNAAGLLVVHPEGHATLRVPAKKLGLPKGTALRIEKL